MSFETEYYFHDSGKEVVIRTKIGKFLRVKPGDLDVLEGIGGKGEFARWIVELREGGSIALLKSKKSGKYLRLDRGTNLEVNGGGGDLCTFRVHKVEKNTVKLESTKFAGKYIGSGEEGGIHVGAGGPWTELSFFREPLFVLPYIFKVSGREVIIRCKNGKYLNVKLGEEEVLEGRGWKHALARWYVELKEGGDVIMLKSRRTGKYLRMDRGSSLEVNGGGGDLCTFRVHKTDIGANTVKLESTKFPGKYVGAGEDGDTHIGAGGPWTELTFFRDE